MRITTGNVTTGNVLRMSRAVVIASCVVMGLSQCAGVIATAQETAEAAPPAQPNAAEQPAAEQPAKDKPADEQSATSDAAKANAATADSVKVESATENANGDSTKVVPADGQAATGDSAVENVSFVTNPHALAMTAIHNRYRSQAGLTAQSVDQQLTNVAQRWAEHMASVGSMYHGGGEQIIAYSGGDLSYEAGFRLWLNSSPHRAWLYSRGERCGFGYSVGRNGCAYFAGAFGGSYSGGGDYSGGYQSASNNGRRFRIFRRRS